MRGRHAITEASYTALAHLPLTVGLPWIFNPLLSEMDKITVPFGKRLVRPCRPTMD